MQEDLDWLRDGKIGVEHNRRRQMQLLRIYQGTKQQKAKKILIDPPGVEKLSRRQELSRSIHQVLRSCLDCVKKKAWESRQIVRYREGVKEVSSQFFKTVFREEKNTDMNAIQHTTQPMIQSIQKSLKKVSLSKNFEHKNLQNTHTH